MKERLTYACATALVATAAVAVGLTAGRTRASGPASVAPVTPVLAERPATCPATDAERKLSHAKAAEIEHEQDARIEANRHAFIRRLSLDVKDNPQKQQTVNVFVDDADPQAQQRLLKRMEVLAAATTLPTRALGVEDTAVNAGILKLGIVAAGQSDAEAQRRAADEAVERAHARVWITEGTQVAPEYTAAVRALTDEKKVKGPYMGVGVKVPDETLRTQLGFPDGTGLVVNFVDPSGPSKDLIHEHDVLQKLDDQILINGQQLITLVRMHKAGEPVSVTVIRSAKPQTIVIKLGEKDLPPLSSYDANRPNDPLGDSAPAATTTKDFAFAAAPAEAPTTYSPVPPAPAGAGIDWVTFAGRHGPVQLATPDGVVTDPTLANRLVYVYKQQPEYEVSALDAKTGKILWKYAAPNPPPTTRPADASAHDDARE